MERERYALLDAYMRKCMRDADGAHDHEHVYRVLGVALDIAATEPEANADVVIAACLLHDIGRCDQMRDKRLCHAAVGAEKAEKFLGVSIADEKEIIYIVAKTADKNAIMKSIMENAGMNSRAKSVVFSIPVTDTAGLRLQEVQ